MATTKLKFKAGTQLYMSFSWGYDASDVFLPKPNCVLQEDFEIDCPEKDYYGIAGRMSREIDGSTKVLYKQNEDKTCDYLKIGDAENWSLFDPKQKAKQTPSSNQLKKYFPAIAAAIVIITAIILLIKRKRK